MISRLPDRSTRVVTQGITGRYGLYHTKLCKSYGTRIVGGVTPGKGGMRVDGIPVFDGMEQCVAQTGAEASMVFVPAPRAKDAVLEAIRAGIKFIVLVTEGIPVHDMVIVKEAADRNTATVIGPNTPGILVPEEAKLGIAPDELFRKGVVGVISRSGTLAYEAVSQLTQQGLGQSALIGIGGDPLPGTGMAEVLDYFESDPATRGILLIGEIGSYQEQNAAVRVRRGFSKPVMAYIAGASAPVEKRLGHAGAVIRNGIGDYTGKVRALEEAGICVIPGLENIGNVVKEMM